jgi:hypothetical protein
MRYFIILIFIFLTVEATASEWAPVYPYIQKTENGKVKCHSFPYAGNRWPWGPGQTFVYYNEKPLYTIEKYFTNPFFTTNNGEYLIEIQFNLQLKRSNLIIGDKERLHAGPIEYEGDAITIYKDGKLFRTISFAELHIDTSKVFVNNAGEWFGWNYQTKGHAENGLQRKMTEHPAYTEADTLFLITADNRLININIPTGKIISSGNAFSILSLKMNWTPTPFKRKYKKTKYPEDFLLPKMKDGRTIAQGLARHLSKRIANGDKDSAVVQIYFYSMLINRQGKCEEISVSPSRRSGINNDFYGGIDDQLEKEIEKWIKEQTFQTKTIPKNFLKFSYTDFVYLKE